MMQVLWTKLSRHLVVPVLALALILIWSQFMQVHADRNQGGFDLKDHSGDRSALADVSISGELGDGYLKTIFKLAGRSGNITSSTQIYDPPITIWNWNDDGTPDKIENSVQYSWNGFDPVLSISYRDRNDVSLYRTASFTPQYTEYNGKHQAMHNSHTFTNTIMYGLAKIGTQTYFTVPSTNSYVGKNGIYKLNFTDGRNNSGEAPESEALVTFSLDKNKEPANSEIQVLGLEAVGDKLALILEEDQKLVIRSYDSKSGGLLGEAVVDGFMDSKQNYAEDYEAFTDHNQLCIAFRSSSEERNHYGAIQKTIWSFDLSGGVKQLDETTISYDDSIEVNKHNMKAISYLNDKLYVIYTHSLLNNRTDEQLLFDPYQPKELIIQVYQEGRRIYDGELVSDQNDDFIRAMNNDRDGFTYDPSQYRAFDHIVIQSIK